MAAALTSSNVHSTTSAINNRGQIKQSRGPMPVRISRTAQLVHAPGCPCCAIGSFLPRTAHNISRRSPIAAAAIEESVTSAPEDAGEPPVSSEFEDIGDGRPFALAVAQEADMLKGRDIMVLHVAPIASWTSYMVLVTAFSRPQMQAMLAKIGKMALGRFGKELPYSKQTSQGRDWECMDFGEVVVQVMTTESRDFYDLEGFYSQAEEIDLPFEGETSKGANAGWQKKLQ